MSLLIYRGIKYSYNSTNIFPLETETTLRFRGRKYQKRSNHTQTNVASKSRKIYRGLTY